MYFEEILDNVNKGEIILGHNDNRLLTIKNSEYPSIIITGSTGTGKSVLLNQIILELINTYTSLEMGLMLIDTSGVELNRYADSKYALYSAINDSERAVKAVSRFIQEMDRRKSLLKVNECQDVFEYNTINKNKLPLLVLAIDDDKLFLRNKDLDKMLKSIFTEIKNLNMMVILSTSDIYSNLFKKDGNTLASTLISFDYQDASEDDLVEIPNISELSIGRFRIKFGQNNFEYSNFEFDEDILNKILN